VNSSSGMAIASVTRNTAPSRSGPRIDAPGGRRLPSPVPDDTSGWPGGGESMATDVQHVGGRLEAVAPRRVTDSGDKLRLAALCAVALVVHGWLLITTHVTARD